MTKLTAFHSSINYFFDSSRSWWFYPPVTIPPPPPTESLRLSGKRFIYLEVAIDGKRVEKPAKSQAKRVVAVISQVIKMYSGHSVLCTLAFCTLISVFTAIWVRLYPDLVTRAFGQCNFFGEGALATCPPTHLKLSGVVLPLKSFSKKVYLHNLKQLFSIKYSCSSN